MLASNGGVTVSSPKFWARVAWAGIVLLTLSAFRHELEWLRSLLLYAGLIVSAVGGIRYVVTAKRQK
jgi:uncharacterized membrane protein YhhN